MAAQDKNEDSRSKNAEQDIKSEICALERGTAQVVQSEISFLKGDYADMRYYWRNDRELSQVFEEAEAAIMLNLDKLNRQTNDKIDCLNSRLRKLKQE